MSLIKTVKLADPAARVPWPGVPGRLIPSELFTVSVVDPFWSGLVADKTLIEVPSEPETPSESEKPGKPKA
ncbi:hypothetical protein [Bosea sp. BK604]|uniref:hypothetical protein n=1 Tax=Bosea sp. BK604 TaxID=2512180 RepID=UPI001048AC4F|nr:hypothetical protein [Bosea sp. BK604]TCR69694.1 hypothetical protein EV560_10191 [Bosea sp. BK604]